MTRAMTFLLHLLALALAPAAASGLDPTSNASREANDLVVYGKVENLDSDEFDDLGMNVRVTARLRITRIVRGRAPSPVLTIRYIAHSYLSEDAELRFRLRRADDGTYLVCTNGGRGYVCADRTKPRSTR
jgi:integration host factor subunit beta